MNIPQDFRNLLISEYESEIKNLQNQQSEWINEQSSQCNELLERIEKKTTREIEAYQTLLENRYNRAQEDIISRKNFQKVNLTISAIEKLCIQNIEENLSSPDYRNYLENSLKTAQKSQKVNVENIDLFCLQQDQKFIREKISLLFPDSKLTFHDLESKVKINSRMGGFILSFPESFLSMDFTISSQFTHILKRESSALSKEIEESS